MNWVIVQAMLVGKLGVSVVCVFFFRRFALSSGFIYSCGCLSN